MKPFLKLCRVIVRKNKGFTVGIFLMSVISFAVAVLGANFSRSGNDTVNGFLADSHVPDVICSTELTAVEDFAEPFGQIDGVACVSSGLVLDTNMTTADGTAFSVRLFTWDPEAPYRQTVHEKAADEIDGARVSVSSGFAEYNGIRAGDALTINSPIGDIDVTVEAIVSNPETMDCVRDEMSAYEGTQFGYLYIDKDVLDEILPLSEAANRWLIFFDDGVTEEEKAEGMGKIRELFGEDLLSETDTEHSDAVRSLRDDMHTIAVLCSFVPGIIWLVSLGFGFIFIKIIVENQRKTVGLLRALGFSARRVVGLFVCYTVAVNIPALVGGVLVGYPLLRLCVGLLASSGGIQEPVISIRVAVTALMILAVFAVGAASALLSAGSVAKVDPSEAYGGFAASVSEPPAILRALRLPAFFKISLASILRNFKRQIIGALCISACVISICVGLEGVLTIGNPIDAVYGGRYRYDLMIRNISGWTLDDIGENVEGIDRIEPFTHFSADFAGESVKVATLTPDAELTVLTDADGNTLRPGDGVIVDEMRAKLNGIKQGDTVELDGVPLRVTGIAREILFTVLYISPETAAELGYPEVNGAMLRLCEDADLKDVERQIMECDSGTYFTRFDLQKENIDTGFQAMMTAMRIFAVLAFGIGSLLVINMSIIDFNESRIRYATLRALGTPVRRMGVIAVIQNLFRVLAGILFSLPLCYLCVSVMLGLLSTASQQYVMVEYRNCLLISCLLPLLYVLVGMGVSLFRIKKLDFCAYLNEVE